LQELALALEPACVSAQSATGVQHPVAGHDDAAAGSIRTRCRRRATPAGLLASVATRL